MYEQEDRHWWFRGRRRVIWAMLGMARLPSGARVLDAGCGTGRNLVELASIGNASGVDPSEEAVAFCRRRGLEDVRCAGIEKLPFEDGQFDVLLAADVLEHVRDDRDALAELRRVAVTGGWLVITAPAYQWLWTEHDVQLGHVRRYTSGQLQRTVNEAGWSIKHATYFNSLLLPGVALARSAARLAEKRGGGRPGHTDLDRTPVALNRLLEVPFRLEATWIGAGRALPAGVSIGLLCRKDL
jgi:SAM-dependent methyltransferase